MFVSRKVYLAEGSGGLEHIVSSRPSMRSVNTQLCCVSKDPMLTGKSLEL